MPWDVIASLVPAFYSGSVLAWCTSVSDLLKVIHRAFLPRWAECHSKPISVQTEPSFPFLGPQSSTARRSHPVQPVAVPEVPVSLTFHAW